jgi:hypothetical protein
MDVFSKEVSMPTILIAGATGNIRRPFMAELHSLRGKAIASSPTGQSVLEALGCKNNLKISVLTQV